MSRHSLKFNLNQRKYNIKFILYLFALLDVVLFFNIPLLAFLSLLGTETGIFIGLLAGLRGQAKLRNMVWELMAIRMDPKYNGNEDLRGHAIKMHLDDVCMEYDFWYQEKKNKTQINQELQNGGKKLMLWDSVVKKQLGYSLIAIWELAVPIVYTLLEGLDWNWALVIFLTGTWSIVGIFVWFYLHYVFNIEPEGEPPVTAPISEPMNQKYVAGTATYSNPETAFRSLVSEQKKDTG